MNRESSPPLDSRTLAGGAVTSPALSILKRVDGYASGPISDEQREQLIDDCMALVNDTRNSRDLRRMAFALGAQLIRERSPAKVRQLEIAKFGRSFP